MFKTPLHKVFHFLRCHIPVDSYLVDADAVTQRLQIVHEVLTFLCFTAVGKIKGKDVFVIPYMDHIKFNAMHTDTKGCPCLVIAVLCIFATISLKCFHCFKNAVKTLQLAPFRAVLCPCA